MKCKFFGVLLLAGAAMCATSASGQEPPREIDKNVSAEEIAQRQLERIDKAVSLTDAQKSKLTSIYKERAKKLKDLREQEQKITKEYKAKEEAVLTDEQKTKLKEQRKAWRQNGERGGKRPAPGPGGRDGERFGGDNHRAPEGMVDASVKFLDEKLGLSDEQKSQIKGFYGSLLESRPASREEGEKKFKEIEEQVKSVLTDDQKAKYEEILKSRPAPGKKRGQKEKN